MSPNAHASHGSRPSIAVHRPTNADRATSPQMIDLMSPNRIEALKTVLSCLLGIEMTFRVSELLLYCWSYWATQESAS